MDIAQEFKPQEVMITCPTTQLPLPTGVRTTAFVYATAVFRNVRVVCPHCEAEHRWGNDDAYLVAVEGGALQQPMFFRRAPGRPAASANGSQASQQSNGAQSDQPTAS